MQSPSKTQRGSAFVAEAGSRTGFIGMRSLQFFVLVESGDIVPEKRWGE
jgi:hypothetical protein